MAQDILRITQVRIQNFRSILNEDFQTSRLNLFVGLNDAGKSNILRALDLFFNGQNAANPFDFYRDFCRHAKVSANKAKEVRVHVTVKVPESYGGSEVYWKKVWRIGGLHEPGTEMYHADGTQFKAKSRIPSLLKAVRFEYVPAIKGNEYFAKLLSALHDVLVDTVEKDIRAASGTFTSTINDATKSALREIEQRLGIVSSIELPSDLRDLFSRLEFQSKTGPLVALAQRGDGIKARHIPILLRYVAQQAQTRRVQGSPQPQTIWGFEEPENNLEMGKAAELAQEFVEYSKEIQILTTTHSPAFYSLGAKDPEIKIFMVAPSGESENTKIECISGGQIETLDERVGLLPHVAPSFARAVADRDSALARLADARKLNRPALFFEGVTDERVLKIAIQIHAPALLDAIVLRSQRSSGGANWAKDMLIAWAHSRNEHKACAVFDADDAGKKAAAEIGAHDRVKSANHSSRISGKGQLIQVFTLEKTKSLLPIFQKGLKLPVALEEMFPIDIWRRAAEKGWLELRSCVVALNKFQSITTTFEDHCKLKGLDEDELFILTNRVRPDEKEAFSKFVCGLPDDLRQEAFSSFQPLIKKLETFFTESDEAGTSNSAGVSAS